MLYRRTFRGKQILKNFVSLPVIVSPLPFLILLDIVTEIYHHTCFPLYGIEKVNRQEYIRVFDRGRLEYLNWAEKLGCIYCGYANGLLVYLCQIAHRTEGYWCGIMHEKTKGYRTQEYELEGKYSEFENKKAFYKRYGRWYGEGNGEKLRVKSE
jgi:hypothetical protein